MRVSLINFAKLGHFLVRFGPPLVRFGLGLVRLGPGLVRLGQPLVRLNLLPLHAFVAKHNIGSIRVLEKNGFTISVEETEALGPSSDGFEELVMKLA